MALAVRVERACNHGHRRRVPCSALTACLGAATSPAHPCPLGGAQAGRGGHGAYPGGLPAGGALCWAGGHGTIVAGVEGWEEHSSKSEAGRWARSGTFFPSAQCCGQRRPRCGGSSRKVPASRHSWPRGGAPAPRPGAGAPGRPPPRAGVDRAGAPAPGGGAAPREDGVSQRRVPPGTRREQCRDQPGDSTFIRKSRQRESKSHRETH